MRRRDFITLVGAGTVALSLAVNAQQPERARRIGVLMNRAPESPEGQARLAAFQQGLQQLGWIDRCNVQMDIRWGADDADLERKYAAKLVALAPDVVFASGSLSVASCREARKWRHG